MKLPKRLELWLLLAAIVAGIVFVFASRQNEDEPAKGVSSSDAEPLKLNRCSIERDRDHARLDIEARVQNTAAEKLVLQAPRARLLTESGREIAGFFLPFDSLPEVAANATQDVQLRYWLAAADLHGALKLEVDGKRIDVKSTRTFALNSLKDAEKKTFNPGEW